MTVAELKAQIMANRMKPVYIFNGVEIGIRDIYLKQIAKVGNYDIKWIDGVSDIIQSGKKKSILQHNTLYILSECSELVKNEKAWKILEEGMGNNMLICMFTTLDKRVKFYKQYKDIMVDFDPLEPELLKKYVQKAILLSDKNTKKLMEICEYDYGRCLLEIDKIIQYGAGLDSVPADTATTSRYDVFFERLLKEGIIYQPPKDTIFDFVDAVLRRDAYNSFRLMQESYDSGEATLVMITNLYNNFKSLLQVQSCRSKNVGTTTGLTGWQITNAKKYVNKYSTKELVKTLKRIRQVEMGIKSGTVDELVAVPQVLINIL